MKEINLLSILKTHLKPCFFNFIKSLILTNQDKTYDVYLEVDYINKDIPKRKKRIPISI